METQDPVARNSEQAGSSASSPRGEEGKFEVGGSVVYALHGKCTLLATETRQVGDQSIAFYKLEPQKSALSRSTRHEPAIWVPMSTARERGLRPMMNREEAEAALQILSSREYYFPVNEPWSAIQPKLEQAIRTEGGAGLAKVASFLYILRRKQVVASSEVIRMQEMINKLLLRELSEVLGEPTRSLEDRISKMMRHKLLPDT